MMRFEDLKIGEKFFHAMSTSMGGVFEKKSLSSAYTLHPHTGQRFHLSGYGKPHVGFAAGVEVMKLA